MPETRWDPLGRRRILLAPERARRGVPDPPRDDPDPAPCDFCPGREDRTPPETLAVRPDGSPPDTPGWLVRTFPNLYPATAVHEVVVHTPDHSARFEELPPGHREDVLRVYRERIAAMDVASVLFAFNRGRRAGASRSHPHGQIFGLDQAPPTLEREVAAFGAEPCVLCSMVADEHIVADAGGTRIAAHPVPLVAHELLVVPPHEPRFTDADLRSVAAAIADALRRLHAAFGEGLALNLAFHSAPADVHGFHWHAHIYPRTSVWGALEFGAELPIVAADPLDTAVTLREV